MDDKLNIFKLGQKIRFERKKRNLSQEELAELANLSIHSVSNIENGVTDVKYSNLLQIAQAFEMKLCELLDFNL